MPTSGLVITVKETGDVTAIVEALRTPLEVVAPHVLQSSVEVGQPIEGRIPFVTETPDKETDKQLWDWLWSLPGVANLDIAFIHLGDTEEIEPTMVHLSKT